MPERDVAAVATALLTPEEQAQIARFNVTGDIVAAIRHVRAGHDGMSLKEAKALVESLWNRAQAQAGWSSPWTLTEARLPPPNGLLLFAFCPAGDEPYYMVGTRIWDAKPSTWFVRDHDGFKPSRAPDYWMHFTVPPAPRSP